MPAEKVKTLVIGGGQAGLVMSHRLKQRGLSHLVLERQRIAERWRGERWDGLRFQFPNWSISLPDFLFPHADPDGFATPGEIVDFITAYGAFLDFVGGNRIWAFGRDDLILAGNLKLYAWSTLPLPPYSNALPWFAEQGVDLKGKHACDVAQAAGVAFIGHKHDALADAHGVAAGFKALIARGAPNPFLGPAVAP